MKLTLFGIDLNTEHEQNLCSGNICKKGFTVKINFKPESAYFVCEDGTKHALFNNVTKVHHLCEPEQTAYKGISIESDIHKVRGVTYQIKDIESVEITRAKKLEERF